MTEAVTTAVATITAAVVVLVAEAQEASVVVMVSGADLVKGRTAAVPVRHAVEIHSVIKNHAAAKNISY